jgi:hypothetical protein
MSELIRIFDPTNVNHDLVQHQQYSFVDPTEPLIQQRMTIYTGEIPIGHGEGEDAVTVELEYPLLGRFPPGPAQIVGIFPMHDPTLGGGLPEFRSAVADACIESWSIKAEDAACGLTAVRAELERIVLDVPRVTIHAVVLKGFVTSQDSQIDNIGFRVSVLERLTNVLPPILFGPGWNGKYIMTSDGRVGVEVTPGVPQM